jgi:hypothetical protein
MCGVDCLRTACLVRARRQHQALGRRLPHLPAHDDQGTSCNGNDSHDSAQSRKTKIEQGY